MKSLQEVWDRLEELTTRNLELESQLDTLNTAYADLVSRAASAEELVLQLRYYAEGMAGAPPLYVGQAFNSELIDSGPVYESDVVFETVGQNPIQSYERAVVTPPDLAAYSGRQSSIASGGGVIGCAYTKGDLGVTGSGFDFTSAGALASSDLWYSSVDGGGNSIGRSPVAVAGASSALFSDPSLAVTPSGNPVIAFRYDSGNHSGFQSELRFAFGGPSTWTLQNVDDGGALDVGHNPSIAILSTAAEEPAICYDDASNGRIMYTQSTKQVSSYTWSAPEVIATNASNGSLAVDGTTIGVSYFDTSTQSLAYATRSAGGVWTASTVDSAPAVGAESSLAFDTAGQPIIAYHDDSYDRLKIAKWNGVSWQINVVTDDVFSAVAGGRKPTLRTLPSGNFGIACLTNLNHGTLGAVSGEATYLEYNGSNWTRFQLHFPAGISTGLAIGTNGKPLVSLFQNYRADIESIPSVERMFLGQPRTTRTGYTTIDHLPGELRISTVN